METEYETGMHEETARELEKIRRVREKCVACVRVCPTSTDTPLCGLVSAEKKDENSNPCGLVTDRDNGEVFVCDFSANRIQAFDKDGNYQRSVK